MPRFKRRVKMLSSKGLLGAAVIALAAGLAGSAGAQSPSGDVISELANNEGIFVDATNFKVVKGQGKGDASAQIAKMGAKEVSPGAIIFRSGDKLYMVEGAPPDRATPQAMKDFQGNWNVSYLKDLKDFQDNWAKSYIKEHPENAQAMKSFQDNWNVSYMKAMKGFQDNWNVSYMKNQNASYMKNQNASYMKDQNASYMKDQNASYMKEQNAVYMKEFQDNWSNSYMKAMKDFQSNWNVSYMKNQHASYLKEQNALWMKALGDFQDNWATS